jgi:uncharacterized protein (TIGR03435 family)
MNRVFQTVSLAVCLTAGALAQQDDGRFDVVSIKRNVTGAESSSLRPDPNGLTGTNVTVRRLLRVAYGVADFQIIDAPGWFDSERYDVVARFAGSAPRGGAAMQVMLADRFGLRVERSSRPIAGFELHVDEPRAPTLEVAPVSCTQAPPASSSPVTVSPPPVCFSSIAGEVIGRGVPAELLATQLTRIVGQPVIDRTGLRQAYDFELRWQPDTPPGSAPVNASLPPLVTAIREQLGLRLVAAKPVVDVYVITAAHRPEEN